MKSNSGNNAQAAQLADRLEQAKIYQHWRKMLTSPMITVGWRKMPYSPHTETRLLVMNAALEEINRVTEINGFAIRMQKVFWTGLGPNALITTSCFSATKLKKWAIDIEDHHPLGALMDLNIIDTNGMSISRRDTHIQPRTCLVCHQDVYTCQRGKPHSLQAYLAEINELILRERFGQYGVEK
ncbi:Apo-citrate lyase phosphoribosyl-dephospho-CoA transferase [Vibrio aerogenes CECT 7868]|uniref:citrate lyase holo-[acyl-carrier protein] synthase n=1 Tax=Vibrio aerogenes CECT 7868 TaxID=1216006 RepID=A0A1M5ZJN8_9VIBR|nr:citrate lyase holo-[acyl-carrier protein] synthase [Vibrio aerogenes]SHI24507.1 Apo-citrate lyase phosphoribosyl-dephospho-CoA transferase [Vibrio aerogenes CECT 7868]